MLVIAIVLMFVFAMQGFALGVVFARRVWRRQPTMVGGGLMYVVSATNPDVGYQIVPPSAVTDSEGNPVPVTALTYEISSDNPSAVALTPSGDNPLTGTVAFGAPNPDGSPALANVNVQVKSEDGTLLGSFGAQFTVPPGAASAIVGGGITFEGLTEQA